MTSEDPPPSSTEGSPLLPESGTPASQGSIDSSSHSITSTRLTEEMDQPWPASYERSISLLASPIISVDRVNLATKSPKPGRTPQGAARRRVSYKSVESSSEISPGPYIPLRSFYLSFSETIRSHLVMTEISICSASEFKV
jgi:hypothetical protein